MPFNFERFVYKIVKNVFVNFLSVFSHNHDVQHTLVKTVTSNILVEPGFISLKLHGPA